MKLSHEQRLLIQEYINHYYELHKNNNNEAVNFGNQMKLLYDYVTHLEN